MAEMNPTAKKRYSILKVRNADQNPNDEEANGTRNPDETDANNTNVRRRVSFHRQRIVQHFDTHADHGRFNYDPHLSSLSSLSDELTRETTAKQPEPRVPLGERRKSAGGEETRGFFAAMNKTDRNTANLTGQFGGRAPLSDSTVDENTQFVFGTPTRKVHEQSGTAFVFEGLPSRASSRPPSAARSAAPSAFQTADDTADHTGALFDELLPQAAARPNESIGLDLSAIPAVTPDRSPARMDTTDHAGRVELTTTRRLEFTMPSAVLERTLQESFPQPPLPPHATNDDDFELMDTKNSLFFEGTHHAVPTPEEEVQEEMRQLSVRAAHHYELNETSINPTLMVVDEQFCVDFNKTVEMDDVEGDEEPEREAEEPQKTAETPDRRKSHVGNRTRVVDSPVLKPQRLNQSEFSPDTGTYVVANPVLRGKRLDLSTASENTSHTLDFSNIQGNLNETGRLIEKCKRRQSSAHVRQLLESSQLDRSSPLADQSALGDRSTVSVGGKHSLVAAQSSAPPLKQLRMSAVLEETPIAVPTAVQQTPDRRERKSQAAANLPAAAVELPTPIAPPAAAEVEPPTPLMSVNRHVLQSAFKRAAAHQPLAEVAATPLTRRSIVPGSLLRKGTTPAPIVRSYADSGFLYGPVQLPDQAAVRWAREEGVPFALNVRPAPLWMPLPDDHLHNAEDARSKDSDWKRAQTILVRVINAFEGRMDLVRAHVLALHSRHAESVRPARERMDELADRLRQLERTFAERLADRDALVERIRRQKDEQTARFLTETERRIAAAVAKLEAAWPPAVVN
ncbi:hypothetical protein M3Y99_01902200 [Aphelenchoides fujianensis]|nr:hypothetical protein M3Y99_01902200 [Aphelenchoides fujianensis]